MAFTSGADRNTHVSIGPYMDAQEHFDTVFTLAWLCALCVTWLWIVNRTAVSQQVTRTTWLVLALNLATSIKRVLSFCVDASKRVVTLVTGDVNDALVGRTDLEAIGGLSRPITSASHGASAQARPLRARVEVGSPSSDTRGRASQVLGIGRDNHTGSMSESLSPV